MPDTEDQQTSLKAPRKHKAVSVAPLAAPPQLDPTLHRAVLFLLQQTAVQNPDGAKEAKAHGRNILIQLGEPEYSLAAAPAPAPAPIPAKEDAPALPPPVPETVPVAMATPISSRFRRG
jgi:hypothetical protein